MYGNPRASVPGSRTSTGHASKYRSGPGKRSTTNNTSRGPLSLPTQILEETGRHTLAVPPHSSSPVLVAEILTMAERLTDISVGIGTHQWAWLVHGRRLILWKFGPHPSGQRSFACRELTLPSSDLAHHAKLVNVVFQGDNPTPSCIAVSPEGLIRFWASVAHESNFIDVSADLQGQECCSLTDIHPVGSLLATTTSNVGLIAMTGTGTVSCRMLKIPSGILGGIGRRVSSLFWGSVSNGLEARLVQVLGRQYQNDLEEKLVFVLTSNSLQKWLLIKDEPDKMFYSCDLETLSKQSFVNSGQWASENVNLSQLKVWLLDMQASGNNLIILMGCSNPQSSNAVYFGLGTISILSEAPPVQFRSFCLLKHSERNSGDENQIQLRFLPHGTQYAYIYNDKKIHCCSASVDEEDSDELDFSQNGNAILGAGMCGNNPYFYVANQGLVTLNPTNMAADMTDLSLNESTNVTERPSSRLCESLNLSVSQNGLENLAMSESKNDQLKAAFLLFCQRNFNQSLSIIEELFPVEPPASVSKSQKSARKSKAPLNSSLDKLVLSMSQDLIDDFPALDPRWMESVPEGEATNPADSSQNLGLGKSDFGSTTSLLILHQLEDKQRALDFYINFLKEVELWQRLSYVTAGESNTLTTFQLLEHVEKTASAISLRQVHSEYQLIVDKAIKRTLTHREEVNLDRGLTAQDHFYREISRVGDIVAGLLTVEEEAFISERPKDIINIVLAVNSVITTVFRECLDVRTRKLQDFTPTASQETNGSHEFFPWTSTPGPKGMRAQLLNQFKITNDKTYPFAESLATKKVFCNQMVELADIILDGYRAQLEGLQDKERKATVMAMYEKDRAELITPLVDKGFYEEAASLAEKYYEFVALIAICNTTNDKERLEHYMDKFSEHNFAEFVFAWHIKEGKQGRLLAESAKNSQRQTELGRFLHGYSDISWMHDIQTKKYGTAAETLKGLAENESDYCARKKTMLSLAKLSALASDWDDNVIESKVNDIEEQLNVVNAQEELPSDVLDSYGFEKESMRVLSPRELIELYVGNDNVNSDHIDFKKALDLLQFVPANDSELLDDLKLHIFAKAVLKDDWNAMDVDNPLQSVKDSTFFKLAEFCYLQGSSLEECFPLVEKLLADKEVQEMYGDDKNFEFLLRSGYEHMQRVSKEISEETAMET